MDKKFQFEDLAKSWPSPIIVRDQRALDKFSGGILNAKTLANLDAKGEGPATKLKVGRKVAYPVQDLIDWIISKQETT